MALADRDGLRQLADARPSVPGDRGANVGAEVTALVAGMLAGAHSIEDMHVLRHGGMARLVTGRYAPSTLGSFLRNFALRHVRQLEADAARLVAYLAARTPLLRDCRACSAQMPLTSAYSPSIASDISPGYSRRSP